MGEKHEFFVVLRQPSGSTTTYRQTATTMTEAISASYLECVHEHGGSHDTRAIEAGLIEAQPLYDIVRFFADETPAEVVRSAVTLAEAKAHCSDPDTRGEGWFDGYRDAE